MKQLSFYSRCFWTICCIILINCLTLKAQDSTPPMRGIFDSIYFEKGKAELKANSWQQLEILLNFLKNKSEYTIKIGGHTDNKGDDMTNINLSILRAEAVKRYFVDQGIPHYRVKAVGYGAYQPIADNATEEGKAKNRRVAYRIFRQ